MFELPTVWATRSTPAFPCEPRQGNLVRRHLAAVACLLSASACGRLESIPCDPEQTPATWLASQPFVELTLAAQRVVVMQPSSSAIVYLLGLLTIAVGFHFLRIRERERSRLWWGFSLLLWGTGALLAGTSYQAFSYAIKCAGRATCAWTSWWEVGYLLLTVWGIDAMTLGTAHACTAGRGRRALALYAAANAALYTLLVLGGAFAPNRWLVSFELLVLFAAPGVAVMLGLNAWRYLRGRHERRQLRRGGDLDRALLSAWISLILTLAGYFLYIGLEVTQTLWAQGVWFSENDLLHLGLILWMLSLAFAVAPRLRDLPPTDSTNP